MSPQAGVPVKSSRSPRRPAFHVLPTGGTARFSSPLGVYDFVKRTSFVQFSKDALKADVEAITTLAREEGLEAHARAVESRFGKEDF